MDRRTFIRRTYGIAAARALAPCLPPALLAACSWPDGTDDTSNAKFNAAGGGSIDRRALVGRHSPFVTSVDPFSVLSVGNGNFAFTADATGLQSFPNAYTDIPLATQSNWGWHRFPNPEGFTLDDALSEFDLGELDSGDRSVSYADLQQSPAGQWLRQNPHRLSLARIGFDLRLADGSPASAADLTDIEQRLDLWTGTLTSVFLLEGQRVEVSTRAHPTQDVVAFRVSAPTLPVTRRAILIDFPYGAPAHTGDPGDWSNETRHETVLDQHGANRVDWLRTLDNDSYVVGATWSEKTTVSQQAAHRYRINPASDALEFELVVAFSPEPRSDLLPETDDVRRAGEEHWSSFWLSGGAIDLSGSTDTRAHELERRIVLSQYLTAIQCSGDTPPQETGLTFNSWHGKFHLEMHWWHAVHFAYWNRLPLLENSLPWYRHALPAAKAKAERQGYAGARWPKMVGPDGRESPSTIGVFLIWQQPHPIYYAELVYRARPERSVLDEYREIVFETADFMASYPSWHDDEQRFVLGPPLIPAQELHPARTTINPTFELAYWRFGLETAQRWRERLGMERHPDWDHVLEHLSELPTNDGLYTNAESDPDTFTDIDKRRDHPTLLGAYGFIGSPEVDPEMMRRTLQRVMTDWQWAETWGWDYPLVAMTAARLGEPEIAIDALLMDTEKNLHHPNGHNYQRPGLTIYLPGNGGLLTAVAMMAAGWDGGPDTHAPGFPRDNWNVRFENLASFI